MEFLKWYREDPDDLLIWDEATEAKIKNLGYKFSDLISQAKTARTPASRRGVTQHSMGRYWTTTISKHGGGWKFPWKGSQIFMS